MLSTNRRYSFAFIVCLTSLAISSCLGTAGEQEVTVEKVSYMDSATGLVLPKGFSSTIYAEGITRARHIAVNEQGDVYAKLGGLKDGAGIIFLRDTNGDGKADEQSGFGDYGGTGIYIKDRYLYASSNDNVYRYKLDSNGRVIDPSSPEIIVSGLINRRQHNSKSITLDNDGNVYVNIGAYSNACQEVDRSVGSLGMQPCPILDSAAGIWKFKADKIGQTYGDGTRYATGLRNVVGLDWNPEVNQLYVTQHGRDQLSQFFPNLYDEKMSADLPAETMYAINEGDDCGWPYIYYDQNQKKKILSPEYGGDGRKTGGENAIDPLMAFPAHIAPNALLFYTGDMFPERYKNGAFIAFHGSWNRSPLEQEGYYVAFVPMKNGKPIGGWEVFADNFAGKEKVDSPGEATYRPCGLAQGPDGSLYVSDDAKGTIFRITYQKG